MTFRLCPRLILLALVFPALGFARGQDQPAAVQVQLKEIAGTIGSVDESCSFFFVQRNGNQSEAPLRLTVNAGKAPWSHESGGCSFASLRGNKMLLKTGTMVVVRYSEMEIGNVANWVIVRSGKSPCEGQGGADLTPYTLYYPGCDGIPQPACVSCPNPDSTERARAARSQANIRLSVVIMPDGSVSDVQLVRGFDKQLDQDTLRTVRKWRFKPIVGPEGKPVWAAAPVEVTFRTF